MSRPGWARFSAEAAAHTDTTAPDTNTPAAAVAALDTDRAAAAGKAAHSLAADTRPAADMAVGSSNPAAAADTRALAVAVEAAAPACHRGPSPSRPRRPRHPSPSPWHRRDLPPRSAASSPANKHSGTRPRRGSKSIEKASPAPTTLLLSMPHATFPFPKPC